MKRQNLIWKPVLFGIVFFTGLIGLTLAPVEEVAIDTKETVRYEAIVLRVIDGDTLEVSREIQKEDNKEERIRLLGIDAPEVGKCFSQEAEDELSRLVSSERAARIILEGDSLNENADQYGRSLRYVYLDDGTLVNAELLKYGFARHLSWFPIEMNEYFAELEAEAKAKNLGLWSACK